MSKRVSRYDTIVLGSGIAGLSTAVALLKLKQRVLIIDKPSLKGQATPAAAGILDPLLETGPGNPLLELSRRAFRAYPESVREIRKAAKMDLGYQKTGLVYLALTAFETTDLKKKYQWQKRAGIPVRWLEKKTLLKLEPSLTEKVRCGIRYPTSGCVQPEKLKKALVRYANRKGAKSIRTRSNPSLVVENSRICGVRLGRRLYASSSVVVATGSWACRQPRMKVRPPVRPARGQAMILKGPAKISNILHSLQGSYIVPRPGGEFLLGSTVENVGFQPRTSPKGLRSIRRAAAKLVPQVRRYEMMRAWAGLRPCSKDRLPILGASTRTRGLFFAAGFFKSGILIGFYAGQLLAKGMVRGRMPKILKRFTPQRFRL